MNANHNSPRPHESLQPPRSRWDAPFRSRWSVAALSALVLVLTAPAAFADDNSRVRGDKRVEQRRGREVRIDSHSTRGDSRQDRGSDRNRGRDERHDSGRNDRHDSGRYDGGRHDSGRHDSGRYDSGRHDSGRYDSGRHDGGRYDGGRHDGGRYDSGRHDSGRYDRHDSGRYDRHDSGRYNRYDRHDGYKYDWNRYDRYSHHNHSPGAWCRHSDHGHHPYFYFPRRIAYDARYVYRDYYYDQAYYPAHGHYHTIYRFPVYVGATLTYRPYSYCDGEFFASGYFAVDGPHFSIHLNF